MNLFRFIYFLAALVGLIVNVLEWRHAKCIYADLIANRINSTRQMLALMLVREELLRVTIQALLFIAALIGLFVWTLGLVRLRLEPSGIGIALLGLSQLVHIAAVVLLAAKALLVRRDRIAIMNVLHADSQRRNRQSEVSK